MSRLKLIPIDAAIQELGVLVPATLHFFNVNPYWVFVFALAYGFYAGVIQLKQDRVNEIIEFLEKHPDKFRLEIVNSKEFQEGFIIFFEEYLKSRVKRKREILKNILLGFTSDEDKENYELERLNDCLTRITIPTLDFLILIKEVMLPLLEKNINEELDRDARLTDKQNRNEIEAQMKESKSIWEFIEKWVYDNFHSESDKVKERNGKSSNEGWDLDKLRLVENEEKEKRREINDHIAELVTLGLFRMRVTGGLIGSAAGSDYTLTGFGVRFMEFLNQINLE